MAQNVYHVRIPDYDEDVEYEAVVDDPPGPKCARCGHEPCPCCGDWCDTVGEDDEGNDLCPCQETSECVFDPLMLAAYLAEVERRRNFTCFGGCGAMFVFGDAEEWTRVRAWYWERESIRLRHDLRFLDAANLAAMQSERLRSLVREHELSNLWPYQGFTLPGCPPGDPDDA